MGPDAVVAVLFNQVEHIGLELVGIDRVKIIGWFDSRDEPAFDDEEKDHNRLNSDQANDGNDELLAGTHNNWSSLAPFGVGRGLNERKI